MCNFFWVLTSGCLVVYYYIFLLNAKCRCKYWYCNYFLKWMVGSYPLLRTGFALAQWYKKIITLWQALHDFIFEKKGLYVFEKKRTMRCSSSSPVKKAYWIWAVFWKKTNMTFVFFQIFFIFVFKKIKISKIYDGFEKFQNYTPVAPCLGDRGPVAPCLRDRGPVALWLGDRT